jgi:hypothetical protein
VIAQEVSSFSPKGRSASKIGSIYRSGQQTFCASARIASPPGVARVLRGCQHPGCRLAEIGLHGTAWDSERLCALPALLCRSGTALRKKWHRPLRPLASSRRAPITVSTPRSEVSRRSSCRSLLHTRRSRRRTCRGDERDTAAEGSGPSSR